MARCVPIKDMRDTAEFAELVRNSPEPITVTKNGYDEFVCMTSAEYERLKREASAREKLLARIELAKRERIEGRHADYDAATQALRAQYGL